MIKRIPQLLILIAFLPQLRGQGGGQGYGDMVIMEIPFTHIDSLLVGGNNNWDFSNYNGAPPPGADNEDYAFTLNVYDTVTIDISVCNPITHFDTMLGVFRKTPDSTYVDSNLVCLFPHAPGGNAAVDCFGEDTFACTEAIGGPGTEYPDIPDRKSIIYGYELTPDINKALEFDGTDDYVDLGVVTSNLSSADFTIEAWLKTTSTNGQGILVKNDGDGNWETGEKAFYINGGGFPAFVGFGNDYINCNTSINDGLWHHVVVVWNYSGSGSDGEGRIYVDGVDCTENVSYAANNEDVAGNQITIGAPNYQAGEAPNYFFGQIDEIALWDTELSAAEVAEIYNNGISRNANINVGSYISSSSLVAYWRFNEESGNTVQDVSINSNTGIINGGASRVANGITAVDYYIVVDTYLPVSSNPDPPSDFMINVSYTVPPFITGFTLEESNNYVDITINESTYSSETPWDNATPLDQGDFTISNIQLNGGNAGSIAINGISNTNGEALQGGELTVRLNLNIQNQPSGVETFEIKPVNSTSIYDGGASAMIDTSSSGVITLNGAGVMILESILEDDNSYITITFNDTVYSNQAANQPLNPTDFDLIFNQNANAGGNATNVTIDSLKNSAGENFTGGLNILRIYLTITNIPSGDEQFKIKPRTNSSIYNKYSVAMQESAATGNVFLKDKLAPSIIGTNIQANNNLSFTSSERLYKTTNQSDEVDEGNFLFDFNNNGGTAQNITINSVTTPQPSSTEYIYTLNLEIDPLPSGVETVYFYPNQAAVIYDGNGNLLADSTELVTLIDKVPPILEPQNSSLDESNIFVILTFTEGLYGDTNGNPVTTTDFIANIITPDNTTTATITSVLRLTGVVLSGGETSIKVNISYDNPASGSEIMEIQPQDNQVFDRAENAVIGSTNAWTVTLNDVLAPSVTFIPENNGLIYPDDSIKVTLSENVRLLNDADVTNANIGDQITLDYIDGNEESISVSATIENNVITIRTPGGDLGELRHVRVSILDGLEDFADNQMEIHTANFTVRDITPPVINTQVSSIITSNAYAILSFSEGVYTNNNATGGLQISDFTLEFDKNGGNATAAEISGIQRPGPSGQLLGGEDSIWVYLNITGAPIGVEIIKIESDGNEAVFDSSGNPLSYPNSSTSNIILNPYPRLTDNSLDDNNGYVDLIFSEGVFSAIDPSSAVEAGDFIISFIQNNGNANGVSIDSLKKIDGTSLLGGETNIRAVISVTNSPASGAESFQITPLDANSICNSIGNKLSISDCTVEDTLNDFLPPTITAAELFADTIVSISASEGIYNTLFGGVDTNNFYIEFFQNNGNASTVEKINVSKTSQDTLIGGETTILIGFTTDSLPSGSEEIEFHPGSNPNDSFYAIYDSAHNAMLQTTISERVTLPDRLPPKIIASSANISNDNSYVIFTLTEGVYGVSETTAPVEPDDFTVGLIQNGGNATYAEVNYITNSEQFPPIGGENILRCYITIQGTPSGHERLYLRAANDSSVFDLAGNGMPISQVTDTLQLFDQLVPTVDSVSIPHGSPIGSSVEAPIDITFSEPIQSFGYSVIARHYNYLTYSVSTTATGFKVTLQPPMASLDTITITIDDLTDSSGLEAVDFSYEYYTPPLGDYDIDGRVNVEDLAQFVSFWIADSQPAILGLGPTTGTFPYLVPLLDEKYGLDDGMTFIRMWSWSLDKFGLEPLATSNIGIDMNWDKLVVDIPVDAIAGQVYLRYNPSQGKVDLDHTAFGKNNLTLKWEAVEKGEILLEFGLVELDDNARVITIKPEIDELAEATVIYKFFAEDQSIIAAGTQKIVLVIPTEFRLMQNYPNPFNNTTTIRYAVPEETYVQLEIFDINGHLVETLSSQSHKPGFYTVKWSGRRVASGIYFIKLEAGKILLTQKMILLK